MSILQVQGLAHAHLPVFIQGSPMEAHNCAYKDEEGRELDEHGPSLDQASMPQNCWNSQTSHGGRTSQELRSIHPPEIIGTTSDLYYYDSTGHE